MPHKGPFNIKLVCFDDEVPGAPLQMNVICTACNGSVYARDVYAIQNWASSPFYGCPRLVVPLIEVNGNVDLKGLLDELEKRRQI